MIFAMGRVTSGGSSIAAFVFDRQKGAFMVWLILLIAAVVLAPVLVWIIGNIDYKRQITGKKKMGKLKDSEHVYQEEKKRNPEMELLREEPRLKSAQNLFGPW